MFRTSAYLLQGHSLTPNSYITIQYKVLHLYLDQHFFSFTVCYELLCLAFYHLPTDFLSDMWCSVVQGKNRISKSSTFRPREVNKSFSTSTYRVGAENDSQGISCKQQQKKSIFREPSTSQHALLSTALAGAQCYSPPHQDQPWSELFIYQSLIELMFTHDCGWMINLL